MFLLPGNHAVEFYLQYIDILGYTVSSVMYNVQKIPAS